MADSKTKVNSRSFRLGAPQGWGAAVRPVGTPEQSAALPRAGPAMTPPRPASGWATGDCRRPAARPGLEPPGRPVAEGPGAPCTGLGRRDRETTPFLPAPRPGVWGSRSGWGDQGFLGAAGSRSWEVLAQGGMQHKPPTSRMIHQFTRDPSAGYPEPESNGYSRQPHPPRRGPSWLALRDPIQLWPIITCEPEFDRGSDTAQETTRGLTAFLAHEASLGRRGGGGGRG